MLLLSFSFGNACSSHHSGETKKRKKKKLERLQIASCGETLENARRLQWRSITQSLILALTLTLTLIDFNPYCNRRMTDERLPAADVSSDAAFLERRGFSCCSVSCDASPVAPPLSSIPWPHPSSPSPSAATAAGCCIH